LRRGSRRARFKNRRTAESAEAGGEAVDPILKKVAERALFRSELVGPRIAEEAAKQGFDKVVKSARIKGGTHGQKVFTDGKRFLTKDTDGHSFGVWKLFDRKGNRLGTYDQYLKQIAD
jgi:hypothetical protein